MRIKPSALGLSAALVMAAAFGLCGLFFTLAPGPAAAFFSWVLHVDVTQMTRHVSLGNLFVGIGLFGAYVGLLVALIAALYNRLLVEQTA